MTFTRRVLFTTVLTLAVGATTAGVVPAQAAGITVPVQCELGSETLLPWNASPTTCRAPAVWSG